MKVTITQKEGGWSEDIPPLKVTETHVEADEELRELLKGVARLVNDINRGWR